MKPANYQTPKNTRGGKNALAQTLRRAFQPLSEDLACAALMAKPSGNQIICVAPSNCPTFDQLESKIRDILNDPAMAEAQPKALIMRENRLWERLRARQSKLLNTLAQAQPLVDQGLLTEIKLLAGHAQAMANQFAGELSTYALVGSRVRDHYSPQSDIDLLVIFDDTGRGEAGAIERKQQILDTLCDTMKPRCEQSGITRKISFAVYRMTDMCAAIHDSRPILVTMVADGVPLLDTGLFTAWQRVIARGKMPPSKFASESLLTAATQRLCEAEEKLSSALADDAYYAVLNSVHALLMAWGEPPPIPLMLSEVARHILIDTLNLLSMDDLSVIDDLVRVHKSIEREPEASWDDYFSPDIMHRSRQLVEACEQRLLSALILGAVHRTAALLSPTSWAPGTSPTWRAAFDQQEPALARAIDTPLTELLKLADHALQETCSLNDWNACNRLGDAIESEIRRAEFV
jgi:predicted nucleotidyltransferase